MNKLFRELILTNDVAKIYNYIIKNQNYVKERQV